MKKNSRTLSSRGLAISQGKILASKALTNLQSVLDTRLKNGFGKHRVTVARHKDLCRLSCPEHGTSLLLLRVIRDNWSYNCPDCAKDLKAQRSKESLAARAEAFKYALEKAHAHLRVLKLKTSQALVSCSRHGLEFHVKFNGETRLWTARAHCPKCAQEKKARSFVATGYSWTKDSVNKQLKARGDGLRCVVWSGTTRLSTFKCPEGHVWRCQGQSTLYGAGCPACARDNNPKTSQGEQELYTWVKSLCPDAIANKWVTLDGVHREADIWIPSKKLVLEFNGVYWHRWTGQDKTRHLDKSKAFETLGYRVIHIADVDWNLRKFAFKHMLSHTLGRSKNQVYARHLSVVELTSPVADAFYNKYHIQGAPRQSKHLGLVDPETKRLYACMSFSRNYSSRGSRKSNLVELVRFASSCSVVGGASRLLFHARARLPKGTSIVSYSQNDWFTGDLYKTLGFKLDKILPPSYRTLLGKKLRPPQSTTRSKLEKILGDKFDPTLSESQNVLKANLIRLYDTGKKRWILKD